MGISCDVFTDIDKLCNALDAGADSLLLCEGSGARAFLTVAGAARQPADVVGTAGDHPVEAGTGIQRHGAADAAPGNVSVVERPVRMSTLLLLVRSSLRAARAQYQLRDFLRERELLLESERFARSDAERGRSHQGRIPRHAEP